MDLKDPMTAFVRAAEEKDRRGCEEHRGGDDTIPFRGCEMEEYLDEQLDSYNYLTRLYARGTIALDEYRRGVLLHMECWFWMEANVRKRESNHASGLSL